MYRISEKDFLNGYCDWCSKINWYTAQVLLAQLKSVDDLEVKKALFIKIYMEYIQASEHLIVLLHTVKQSSSLVGFRKRIVKCPADSRKFRYLYDDLKKFEKNPREIYSYLGIQISNEEYENDRKALDGFYSVALTCLKIRFRNSREGRTSKLLRVFGKFKHGFPLHSPTGTKAIFIYLSSGKGIRRIQTNLDEEHAEKLVDTAEAIHNGLVNLSTFAVAKGITKS